MSILGGWRLGRGDRRIRRGSWRLPAAALLEVVIAISILLVAMSVVGAAFRNGAFNIEKAEQMTQAMIMTDRLLAHVDLGVVPVEEQETVGWFAEESIPNLSWKLAINRDINMPGMLKLDVQVYLGDPEGTDAERQLLLTTHVLRAEPRAINFATDFGFTEEQMEQLTDAIPGGAAVFDPTNFDPRSIAQLDLATLKELLPTLIQAFGGNMAGGDLGALLKAAQEGDLSGLQELAGQLGEQSQQGALGQQPGAGGQPPPGVGGSRRGSRGDVKGGG